MRINLDNGQSTEWQAAAQDYLKRLAFCEYALGSAKHKPRRKPYRHAPSEYHNDLVEALGRNDEEAFKAIKMLRGYSSALGV